MRHRWIFCWKRGTHTHTIHLNKDVVIQQNFIYFYVSLLGWFIGSLSRCLTNNWNATLPSILQKHFGFKITCFAFFSIVKLHISHRRIRTLQTHNPNGKYALGYEYKMLKPIKVSAAEANEKKKKKNKIR